MSTLYLDVAASLIPKNVGGQRDGHRNGGRNKPKTTWDFRPVQWTCLPSGCQDQGRGRRTHLKTSVLAAVCFSTEALVSTWTAWRNLSFSYSFSPVAGTARSQEGRRRQKRKRISCSAHYMIGCWWRRSTSTRGRRWERANHLQWPSDRPCHRDSR